MRIAIGIALVLAGTIAGQATPTQTTPSSKDPGQFTDFEALTKNSGDSGIPAAASTNATSAKSAAAFVSNVLSLATAPTNTAPLAGLNGYVPDDKYKLRVGDRVSFQIAEDRDPPKPM